MGGSLHGMDRRHFLLAGGGLATLALPLLAACGAPAQVGSQATAAPAAGQPKPAASAKLPTYVPLQGPSPDLPGSPDGLVSPGWTAYPKQLFQAVKTPPGSGGDVTVSL